MLWLIGGGFPEIILSCLWYWYRKNVFIEGGGWVYRSVDAVFNTIPVGICSGLFGTGLYNNVCVCACTCTRAWMAVYVHAMGPSCCVWHCVPLALWGVSPVEIIALQRIMTKLWIRHADGNIANRQTHSHTHTHTPTYTHANTATCHKHTNANSHLVIYAWDHSIF